jgi:hypothetical protein
VKKIERHRLETYLSHALEALAEAREYFSKQWMGQGHDALRECDEHLQGAVVALAACK